MTTAREVIDYIAWMEHCAWVHSVCTTTAVAVTAFEAFGRTTAAERGRSVVVYLAGGKRS